MPIRRWTLVQQAGHAGPGAAAIVQQYGVGDEAAGRTVQEHHRDSHLNLGAQERLVVPGRYHQQAVDPPGAKVPQQTGPPAPGPPPNWP